MSVSLPRRRLASSGGEPESALALAHGLADELARRWAAGERPRTEQLLARFPQLARHPQAAIELIYEEICQVRLAGEHVQASVWLERFPEWRRQIETLLACHSLLENAGHDNWFPKPGETFGDFELLDEFGHGAHGRVYLARQPALADRPVVLKLASLAGQEHLSLARLQHTYIMPLYWSQDDASLGLRALCMPYFGGAPLSQLLSGLKGTPPERRTGRDLLDGLTKASADQHLAPPVQGPACLLLERSSYVDAICFIGACLADALDYAHERNVIHHDIKPSNVLIAADGQPLLLDFHLAQPALEPGATAVEWLGGTPGYMAPEHVAALEAMQRGEPIPRRVDGQADVYGLGLLLCEALAGERPPPAMPLGRWLRVKNNEVSAALADLVAKCTAAEPSERYPSTASLASDLRRHLAHQPLKQVRNRSLPERWRKWRRRRPYALMALSLTAAFAASCVVIAHTVRERWLDAESALEDARDKIEKGRFDLAKMTSDHGLALAGALPWRGQLWQDLQEARTAADQGARVQQLHALVARLRALYGPAGLPAREAERLESDAGRLWNERSLLLGDSDESRSGGLSEVRDDLADLALFWAAVQQRRGGQRPARAVAQSRIDVLEEAERLVGPRLIFCRELARLAKLVGDERLAQTAEQKAATLAPLSGWEHYALGRSDVNSGDLAAADQHFRAAVEMNPKDLWPNFYHAQVAYDLGQYEEAVTAFTVCIVLADGEPWTYYNRGLANLQLKRHDSARRDFDRALELDGSLATAALERGMLSYEEQRYSEAIADLKRASAGGADTARISYGLALAYTATDDRENALRQLDVLFAQDPDHEGGRKLANLLDRGEE